MQFVCDAEREKTWFQIETELEAIKESELMAHAVAKHFRVAYDRAAQSYTPPPGPVFEQNIGREAFIRGTMPWFLTLRDAEGQALVTAMLPRSEKSTLIELPVIVGRDNSDPYAQHARAIEALALHFGRTLDRLRCYPYRSRR